MSRKRSISDTGFECDEAQVEEADNCGENVHDSGEHERLKAQNAHLSAAISRLTTEKILLEDDYGRVKKKNVELVQNIECLKSRLGAINDALSKLSKQISAPLDSGGLARTRPRILLKQVFDTQNGTPFIHMEAPFRSDRSGCFPHAIAIDTHTNKKELQLEHRRPVLFTFSASFEDGSPATEYDIAEDGIVPFRMQFLYADDFSEVKPADFHKSDAETLTSPKLCEIAIQQMVKGMLSFQIKRFNVSTSEGSRRRPILVNVKPVSEDLASDVDLCYRTEPFIIRARITVKKDKA